MLAEIKEITTKPLTKIVVVNMFFSWGEKFREGMFFSQEKQPLCRTGLVRGKFREDAQFQACC